MLIAGIAGPWPRCRDHRPAERGAGDRQLPAVPAHDAADDGQAEARPARSAISVGFEPDERKQGSLAQLLGNARPIIVDGDPQVLVVPRELGSRGSVST
jgi:hypothetical protein